MRLSGEPCGPTLEYAVAPHRRECPALAALALPLAR